MTLTGLVVADDLTGASDTGHEFAARGCRTLVSMTEGAVSHGETDTDVLVVDTDSRYAPPKAAATAVRDAIAGGEHAFVYKKVDSTLRGNLVSEVDAALDATGADLALVAPASPRNGRTTAEGYHLVDGRLVTDTDAGSDPDKPVETAHLPTRFADSAHRVSRLGTGHVAAGSDAIEAALTRTAGEESGPTVVVADATHERHLAALGEGAARAACDVLYVGSAGLARYVETPTPAGCGPEPVGERDRSVLCVVGSTSPTTREQLRALPEDALVALDLATAVAEPDAASAAAATACATRLASSGLAALVSAPDADAADRAIRAGRDRGIDGATVRSRVGRALGGAVERLWTDDPPESLFVTGGAVASDVLSRLGATGVSLSGEAVEEGIPLGHVAGGVADGVPVVTKAGAFGGPGAIRKCAVRLGGRDDLR